MKCGLNRLDNILKILLLTMFLSCSVLNIEWVSGSDYKRGKDVLADFDYLVSQLYLQHCTFIEIGEGVCSLFVELTLNNGCKKLRKQIFFGNCLCSEFRKWHLCSYRLTSQRPEDCEFLEGTSCPSSSARVHRRLCDVTGMSQWNPQCNCSVTLAGVKQDHMCGFKTCYANPMPTSICGPRTVCGTAYCDVTLHGSLYSVHCDRKCQHHQPFCEDPCPPTSLKRKISSEWAEWRSIYPADNTCNMKQFETECLDESCGKDEADCTCEVKIQDGKLKAFRYMINFGDGCDDTTNSKLRVRSIGLKGSPKVWNRFIGADSKDDKGDSISMFGNPAELFKGKFRPKEQNTFGSDFVRIPLQNSGTPDDRSGQQMIVKMDNQSQNHKIIQGNISPNVSGANGSEKFVNLDLTKLSPNQTLDLEDKQKVNPNRNQLLIISNNSKSNEDFNQTHQNPQYKLVSISNEIVKENSLNHLTPLPYINTTNKLKIQDQNNDDGKIMTEGVIKPSNINATLISDVKDSEEQIQRETIKNITGDKNNEPLNNKIIQNQSQIVSEKVVTDRYKEQKNNSRVKTVTSTKDVVKNQNMILEKPMITLKNNSLNGDKVENSLQSPDANTQTERKASEPQNTETDNNKEKMVNSYIDNPQKSFTEKTDTQNTKMLEKIGNEDSHQSERKTLAENNQQNKVENESKENNSSIDRKYLDTKISQESSPDTQNISIRANTPDNDFKSENEMGLDTNRKTEKTENVIKKELNFGEIQINGDRTKGQENSSMDEEDKVELKGNENDPVIFPAQIKQNNNLLKSKENLVTSKLIDQVVTTIHNGGTNRRISTGIVFNNPTKKTLVREEMTNNPMVSLNRRKNQNISGLSNIVKLTTVGSKYNTAVISDKNNERKISELNSQKSLPNELTKTDQSLQNNSSPSFNYTDQKKTQSVKKQSLDKKVQVNDIANILPNIRQYATPEGLSGRSTKRRLRPQFLHENEENGITMNIQTTTASGLTPPKYASPGTASSGQTNLQPLANNNLDKKVQLSEVTTLVPNVTGETITGVSSKHKLRTEFLHKNEETGIKLNIQSMTTPDLWGAIAKKLFKSNSQLSLTDQQDALRMLSESNPPISLPEKNPPNRDYDEPEPVLKDLNKVDKDNLDEKMAEALSQIADLKELPGKVEWSEKTTAHNHKLDFGKIKKEKEEIVNPLKITSTLNGRIERKKIHKNKVKAN